MFNPVMGFPLKVAVACSEVAIALGDGSAAVTYLSASPDFFVSVQIEIALGAFVRARVASQVDVDPRWIKALMKYILKMPWVAATITNT